MWLSLPQASLPAVDADTSSRRQLAEAWSRRAKKGISRMSDTSTVRTLPPNWYLSELAKLRLISICLSKLVWAKKGSLLELNIGDLSKSITFWAFSESTN